MTFKEFFTIKISLAKTQLNNEIGFPHSGDRCNDYALPIFGLFQIVGETTKYKRVYQLIIFKKYQLSIWFDEFDYHKLVMEGK